MVNDKQEIIKSRLQHAFCIKHLEVFDESDQHIGHAGHQGGGRHFAIVIESDDLRHLTRIDAHRKIYALFTDLMPDQIHALKIKIIF